MSFRMLLLPDQQSKSQGYSIYCDIKHIKAANPHISVAGTRQYLDIFLDKWALMKHSLLI